MTNDSVNGTGTQDICPSGPAQKAETPPPRESIGHLDAAALSELPQPLLQPPPLQPQPLQPTEQPTEPPTEPPWRRLHPLSPLLRGGLFLIVIVGIIISNLRDRVLELFFAKEVVEAMGPNEGDLIDFLARQSLLIWALVALIVAILLIISFSGLSWYFSTFRISSDAVESRGGVLFRQHRRAPLERVQSVNLQRSLLARLIGLTEVELQTGGQGGKVSLRYLGHREAKEVREKILLAARLSKAQAVRPPANVDEDTVVAVTPVLSGYPSDSATPLAVDFSGQAYAVTTGALDGRLRDLVDFDIDPSARESGSLIKVPVGRLVASILLGFEMLVVVAVIICITIMSIWATPFALAGLLPLGLVMASVLISQFNRGFNFVLSRAEDGVRIGAGLTATTTETIPFGRVHAVEALQPLGWRPLGWWKVRITTAGHSTSQAGQNKLQNVVLPVGGVEDVLQVFETLLHAGAVGTQSNREALRHALVGDGAGYVRPGPKAAVLLWFAVGRAGLQIDSRNEDHASLRIRRGFLTRSLSVMPIMRAQSVQLSRPLVHHLLGLASVQVHTVLGPARMYMRGLGLEQARLVFGELAETIVRVQRRDATGRFGATQPEHSVDLVDYAGSADSAGSGSNAGGATAENT